MTTPSPNRLLTALQTYRPGSILHMGDLKDVKRGLSLFENLEVEWLVWHKPEGVKLKLGKLRVTITLNQSGTVVCTCSSCGANKCAHSVAAMATVMHGIRGKLGLSSLKLAPDTFADFREALFAGPDDAPTSGQKSTGNEPAKKRSANTPTVRIVQDNLDCLDAILMIPRASLSLRGNGSFASPMAVNRLPMELRELFSVPIVKPHELEDVLFEFIQRFKDKFPIVVDSLDAGDGKPVQIEGIVKVRLAGLLILRRFADTGTIETSFAVTPMGETKGAVSISSDPPLTEFYRLGKSLIFHPKERTIGRVYENKLWESVTLGSIDNDAQSKLFQRYRKTRERKPFQLPQPVTKSIEEYNEEPFFGTAKSAPFKLVRYYDGDSKEAVHPVPMPATVSLAARVDTRSGTVKMTGKVEAQADISAAFDAVAELLEYIDETVGLSASRRRPLFQESRIAMGEYLLCDQANERALVAKSFLNQVGSDKRAARQYDDYKGFFRELEAVLKAPAKSYIAAALPGSEAGTPPWIYVDADHQIRDAVAACYLHFPGFKATIIDELDTAGSSMSEFEISASEWKHGLAKFSAECSKRGVTLTIDNNKTETVALDFMVRAEPVAAPGSTPQDGNSIDWFALHPKIFCDQMDVPQEQWSAILQGGTFQAEGADGIIQVVDTESLERFALFLKAGASTGSQKKKAEEGDAVKVPRLQILDWMQLKSKGIEIVLPDEDAAIIDSLLSGKPGNPAVMPETIQATLRPYQITGYRWMAFLYEHRFGAVLADDMGLGKTLQTITLLAALDAGLVAHRPKEKYPHLAVLPPSLIFNWRSEIERFLPGITIYEYTGGKRSLDELRKADVVLTTYELARRDIEKLENERFDVIIFDEAQAVKNIAAARSKAIRRLTGRFRLCLTGTPLENHVGEYFAILDLALPGLLGEGEEAKKALRANADSGNERYLRRSQPFVLRRTKENVLKDLPPKVESDIYLDLDRSQKEFYMRTVAEVRNEVAKAFAHKPKQQAGIVALSALMRLRQICVAPGVIDPSLKNSSAPKLDYLVEKLQELHQEGHAALVFSQFTRVLDIIEPLLKAAKLKFVRLDGKTPQKMRKKHVDAFQDDAGPDIFLISLKAGGSGLNLTRASYVFHLDPWWNPAVERQASDRAHRIGQKNKVFIHRILMRDTIEEKMMILKARKQELYDEIMGSAEAEGERIQSRKAPMITPEDISFLLG
ncbi:MAG: superfamily II DNA or RNA helicase [Verrucomicrobiales bacterium]